MSTQKIADKNQWDVHKFGGTSVANSERYQQVAQILKKDKTSRLGVVVSAMSGVTNALIALVEMAQKQNAGYFTALATVQKQHETAVESLLGNSVLREDLNQAFARDAETIRDLLKAVSISRSCPETTLEMIAGHGEIWSAQILNAYLNHIGTPSEWLDARGVLTVTNAPSGPIVDWELSQAKIDAWLKNVKTEYVIITGYVAATHDGIATTLKRNGSDFSGSIFGALLRASRITIWTDVDGVLTADPRRVPEAVVLDEMSYQEAMELAYFGAKVIHPNTMAPALTHGIPIWIRNTFRPELPGTKIHSRAESGKSDYPVKGFTTVDHVALLNLEGTGMIGVPGIANRLFGALREIGVSVIMISQASSEQSICFAVPEAQGELAKITVEKAFFAEIHQGMIQSVECLSGMSILAAVGDNMVKVPGVAAKFFQALGKASISIRAIAQGSSERNISVVVDRSQATRALRAAHSGFYLSAQTLSVGLIGPGLIGSALLDQIEIQSKRLLEEFKIDFRVRAIADSKKMLFGEKISNKMPLKSQLADTGVNLDLTAFEDHVQAEHIPHSVIVDCTSSDELAMHYAGWLKRGIHVVTPNKKANSGALKNYLNLRSFDQENGSHYLYEATVGAGLPIITTLRDLIRTGDRIIQIEGVLSGTLSYIFNRFTGDTPFSSIVREAQAKGFTEPDPRDDLSGMDVGRKLIILGREIGMKIELSDVEIESLVPEKFRTLPDVSAFLQKLSEFDDEMQKRWDEAQANDEVLRYVGSVGPGLRPSVKLKTYPKTHPFARLNLTDNIFAFTTRRYHEQPLIIQGPGAGPDVTAGGVFGDLLRLAAYVGPRT